MLTIKKKDKVMVKKGKDKGKTGEVLKVFPAKGRIVVSKVNFIKKHTRPSQTSPGGIIEKEGTISICNVQLICPKCNRSTRIKRDRLTDGKKIRICKKCGEMIV